MLQGYVNTLKEEILYEYAKLISRSVYGDIQHGFVSNQFKLKLGTHPIKYMKGTI